MGIYCNRTRNTPPHPSAETEQHEDRGRIVISLGGSLIHGKDGENVQFLGEVKEFLKGRLDRSERFLLVCGGGEPARKRQAAAQALGQNSTVWLDYLGIEAARNNASLVLTILALLGDSVYTMVLENPTLATLLSNPVLVAGGIEPGHSSDFEAVMYARYCGSSEVINLSNVDRIYSSDPNHDSKATPYDRLTWRDYLTVIGSEWWPSRKVPFDPIAAQAAAHLGLTVVHLLGADLANLGRYLDGQSFVGTTIVPDDFNEVGRCAQRQYLNKRSRR